MTISSILFWSLINLPIRWSWFSSYRIPSSSVSCVILFHCCCLYYGRHSRLRWTTTLWKASGSNYWKAPNCLIFAPFVQLYNPIIFPKKRTFVFFIIHLSIIHTFTLKKTHFSYKLIRFWTLLLHIPPTSWIMYGNTFTRLVCLFIFVVLYVFTFLRWL